MKGITLLKNALRPALGTAVVLAGALLLAPSVMNVPKAQAEGGMSCEQAIHRAQNEIGALNTAIEAAGSEEAGAALIELREKKQIEAAQWINTACSQ